MQNWLILRRKFHEHAYIYMDIHIQYIHALFVMAGYSRTGQPEADVDLR